MDISGYDCLVGYGIGQYYEFVKDKLSGKIQLDYLSDAKWQELPQEYQGIKVISPDDLTALSNPLIIVFAGSTRTFQSISCFMEERKLPYIHANELMKAESSITGKQLREYESVFRDAQGNVVEFAKDIEESIRISFLGKNNFVRIERAISVGILNIFCGNNACCVVGEESEIESVQIYVTDGSVEIGKNCLFSNNIVLRNHDGHHIFDKKTGKRINYAGNMRIGNHVWIGQGAVLLGSAQIGDNSIVGARAVTSSCFPKETIIAGNPARVIREGVCWSKDSTDYFNRDSFDECLAREAYDYF